MNAAQGGTKNDHGSHLIMLPSEYTAQKSAHGIKLYLQASRPEQHHQSIFKKSTLPNRALIVVLSYLQKRRRAAQQTASLPCCICTFLMQVPLAGFCLCKEQLQDWTNHGEQKQIAREQLSTYKCTSGLAPLLHHMGGVRAKF